MGERKKKERARKREGAESSDHECRMFGHTRGTTNLPTLFSGLVQKLHHVLGRTNIEELKRTGTRFAHYGAERCGVLGAYYDLMAAKVIRAPKEGA